MVAESSINQIQCPNTSMQILTPCRMISEAWCRSRAECMHRGHARPPSMHPVAPHTHTAHTVLGCREHTHTPAHPSMPANPTNGKRNLFQHNTHIWQCCIPHASTENTCTLSQQIGKHNWQNGCFKPLLWILCGGRDEVAMRCGLAGFGFRAALVRG